MLDKTTAQKINPIKISVPYFPFVCKKDLNGSFLPEKTHLKNVPNIRKKISKTYFI